MDIAKQAAHGSGPRQVLRSALVDWYHSCARDLPWRRTRDPYAIWVSEVMLQQTRVATVIPYFERFLTALPTIDALARAPLERVLELWSGLGYYRRARLLHRGAQQVVERHAGVLPREVRALLRVSGIGRYTAGAIASIAYDEPAPVVDGNVARVLARLHALRAPLESAALQKKLWQHAEAFAVGEGPGTVNQALMELGAQVCTPVDPDCARCPLAPSCRAYAAGITHTLPKRSPKRAPRRVELTAYVLDTGAAIVCGKRHPDALFGGLWEPPVTARGAPLPKALRVGDFERTGTFIHVLTHRRLEIEVRRARVRITARALARVAPPAPYACLELVPKADLPRRAMSRMARRILGLSASV